MDLIQVRGSEVELRLSFKDYLVEANRHSGVDRHRILILVAFLIDRPQVYSHLAAVVLEVLLVIVANFDLPNHDEPDHL